MTTGVVRSDVDPLFRRQRPAEEHEVLLAAGVKSLTSSNARFLQSRPMVTHERPNNVGTGLVGHRFSLEAGCAAARLQAAVRSRGCGLYLHWLSHGGSSVVLEKAAKFQ